MKVKNIFLILAVILLASCGGKQSPADPGWALKFEPWYDFLALFEGINPASTIVAGIIVVFAIIFMICVIIANKRGGGK